MLFNTFIISNKKTSQAKFLRINPAKLTQNEYDGLLKGTYKIYFKVVNNELICQKVELDKNCIKMFYNDIIIYINKPKINNTIGLFSLNSSIYDNLKIIFNNKSNNNQNKENENINQNQKQKKNENFNNKKQNNDNNIKNDIKKIEDKNNVNNKKITKKDKKNIKNIIEQYLLSSSELKKYLKYKNEIYNEIYDIVSKNIDLLNNNKNLKIYIIKFINQKYNIK